MKTEKTRYNYITGLIGDIIKCLEMEPDVLETFLKEKIEIDDEFVERIMSFATSEGIIRNRLNECFDKSIAKNHKKLNVRWGDINKLIRGDYILELSGGPDIARAIYTKKEKNGLLKATAGDCYILLVEWNKDGYARSESIHQYGSATRDNKSTHYNDQALLFSQNKLKKTSIYIDDILENFKNIQILK